MPKGKREHIPIKLRHQLWRKPCIICGGTFRIRIDHIIPVAKGGKTRLSNLQPLCWQCNHYKKDSLLSNAELSTIVRARSPLHYATAAYEEATQHDGFDKHIDFYSFVLAMYPADVAKTILQQRERPNG